MAVSVVVDIKIKDGQLDEFIEYMGEMIDLTKKEDGCIAYDLYEMADGSEGIVLVEIWEDQEKLDRHMEADHFKKFIPDWEKYHSAPAVVRVLNRL